MYRYELFGLCILSEFLLPGIEKHIVDPNTSVDIEIRSVWQNGINKILQDIEIIRVSRNYPYEVTETSSYVIVEKIKEWKIYISKLGNEILIDVYNDELDEAVLTAMHSGINVCLIFKDKVPLHAAGLSLNNKIIGIIADTGIGKSTFAIKSLSKEIKFVTDDTLPIEMSRDKCFALPSQNFMSKLDNMSINVLNSTISMIGKVRKDGEKYWISLSKDIRQYERQELAQLYILKPYELYEKHKKGHELITIENQSEKMEVIFSNIEDLNILGIKQQRRLYRKIVTMFGNVKVKYVRYHKIFDNIEDIVHSMILDSNM